jgi:CheY-like chemotaxis protein
MENTMPTVLTIDGSRVVRAMVRHHLTERGVTVVEAPGGPEAIEAACRLVPDVILLDATIAPETLADLRERSETASIRVIVLTTEGEIPGAVAALGVSGQMRKPFKGAALAAELERVLAGDAGAAGAAPLVPSAVVDVTAVLVVDGSEQVLAAARDALGQSLTVLTALSREDAVEQYRAARPGVVMIDLDLPDGYETLAEIQKLGPSTCVALARRDDDGREWACDAGFQSVVDKPFDGPDLARHVQGLLRDVE